MNREKNYQTETTLFSLGEQQPNINENVSETKQKADSVFINYNGQIFNKIQEYWNIVITYGKNNNCKTRCVFRIDWNPELLLEDITSIEKTKYSNWFKVEKMMHKWYYYISKDNFFEIEEWWIDISDLKKFWDLFYFEYGENIIICNEKWERLILQRWYVSEITLNNWSQFLLVQYNFWGEDYNCSLVDMQDWTILVKKYNWFLDIDQYLNKISKVSNCKWRKSKKEVIFW